MPLYASLIVIFSSKLIQIQIIFLQSVHCLKTLNVALGMHF